MKGWPDYVRTTGLVENYDEFSQNYPVGIGDGAARLGSIKTYDMRGRAWWMDDFEAATLNWQTSNVGVGGGQALSTACRLTGAQSCALTTNTGAGRESAITKYLQYQRKKRVGLELSFNAHAEVEYIEMHHITHDGADMCTAALRFDTLGKHIYYLNSGGGWTNMGLDWNSQFNPCIMTTAKIVSNTETNEYIRIMVAHQEIDMTGISTHVTPWAIDPRTQIYINAIGDNLNNTPAYIDNVIITTMEPA